MKAMAMAKLKKSVSLLVVLTFILSLVRLPLSETKTANAAEVKVNHYAVLVGDFPAANNLGGDWNPSNMTLLMSQISPDVYVKTVEFTTAGSYQYKAAMDGGWDVSYGDGSNNKLLKVESPGKIQFVLNTKEGKLYDSLNDSTYFKNTATVVGNLDANSNGGPSWNPADSSMDLSKLENGYFKGSLPMKKGNYEYKIAYDHKWSNGEVGSNVKLAVDTDSDVTFFSNFYANLCTDSKSDSSILVVPSLIGTVRQGDDWTADKKGFEFNYFGNHKYIFSKYITKGSYEYKVIMDYKWGNGELPANNKSINVANDNGEYVVFVYDASRNAVFDSINDGNEIAKLFGMLVEVSSPKINADGTITFNYNDVSATSVSLRGSLNGWGETPLIKGADGNWSVKLRACDNAANIEYKFFVNGSNWVTDPLNPNTKDGNSVLVFPQYNGRTVVIAGTIQAVVGEGNWTPSSAKTTMNYVGNGTYKFEMNHVPAGNYEYKVAMGSWEPENYGAGGVPHGPNIQLTVPVEQSITFLYNDDSHRIVDSVSYKMLDAYLSGGPLTAEVKLEDKDFTGLYRTALELEKGVYSNFNVLIKGTDAKIIAVPEFEVDTKKLVTISYDPVTGFVFNDASSKKIEATKIIYNSRDIKFKKPYGAVKQNEKTSFTIETGRDVGAAKLVLLTPEGTKIVDMNITKGVESNTFSTEANFATIGTYSYYFVLTNGSDVVAYGDDVKADLGTGTAGALGSVKNYTVNVYKSDFKTPDWMKNAVVYQIYPDRFFNGDTGNDYLQKYARGYDAYEFYSNWYSIPENPREEQKDLNSYISKGGTVGDGIWSNEMYGGDVAGIKAKLDYLQALGVNVLYLNPVSASISNHRYDTTNYKELDPLLGRMSEYKELADEVNRRGMHLIIDGVYNHVSDDSVYFDRYGKYMTAGKPLGAYQYWSHVYGLINSNGITLSDAEAQTAAYFAGLGITALQYKDWFKIDNVWVSKDGSGKDIPVAQQHYQYEGWWGYDSMPVIQSLNGSELNVASWKDEIVKGNTELWLGQGTAGYRLDVANEVSDETWRYFRDVVKAAGDNVIIGEIWTDASRYIMGDMYDSVMNYRFREAILDYLRDGVSGNDVNNTLEVIREQYPREAFEAMMNLVDSHDTERILSDMDGMVKDSTDEKLAEAPSEKAKRLQRLIPILQMTYPGAPTIYYGDELGMVGAKDPDNRRTMIWGKGDSQTLMAYASSANIRNSYAVLRTGEVAPIESNNSDLLIYERFDNSNEALVVVNKSENQVSLQVPVNHIPDGTVLKDALTGTAYTVNSGKVSVSLSGISGVILVTGYQVLKLDSAKLADGYAADAIVKDKVIPETVKTVIDRVLLPENNGKEVIVSSMSEEIVKAIFDAAVQNNVKPVIVRGDTSFAINNPKAISEAITSAGTTGLILTRNQETALNYKDLAEKLKASKYEMFNFETNINTKIKQDIAVKINITAKKPKLYVYTDKLDGTFEQIIDTAYTGNMLQFKLASFGSIIVSEVPIPQLLNVNYKKK